MRVYAFRLTHGADLKESILDAVKKNGIKAGCIIACVGDLGQATIRMADEKKKKVIRERLEIVSMAGTMGNGEVHAHIVVADRNGKCIGGHMKEGCIVERTAEIVIEEAEGYSFFRELDEDTGYNELVIRKA